MISKEKAYEILELPDGASCEDVIKRYKFLSLEWFPDKHHNSEEAVEKFQNISQALVRLSKPCRHPGRELTMNEMLALFSYIFFGKKSSFSDDCDDSSDNSFDDITYSSDDSDCNFSDFFDSFCMNSGKEEAENMSLDVAKVREAIQNATELIQEEEREKKKAEKRKAKKKRRKERKKQEKNSSTTKTTFVELQDTTGADRTNDDKVKETGTSESEEEIDPNSAFVAVIAKKKNHKLPTYNATVKNDQKLDSAKSGIQIFEDDSSRILRSRQLAIRGNEMANVGCYQEAVSLFSEAIKLDPDDHRYYGNRSYCYDRIGNYERALKDAEKSIFLSPHWAKGFFRKGRALTGLQKYSEAEKCFKTVLDLDPECDDAKTELARVHIVQIMELGFSKEQAEQAIKEHGSVEKAIESLLSGAIGAVHVKKDVDVFLSDEEDDEISFVTSYSKRLIPQQPDIKMDPNNPEGHNSIWIGSIPVGVTEKMLISMFSKFGELLSVKVLPEKSCAFVNYKQKNSAGLAMRAMQGAELYGKNIVIRFPGKPTTVKSTTATKKTKASEGIEEAAKGKSSGPINGEECYFWRTTGCIYGNNCRYKHVQAHKGIDKKDWHRVL